MAEKIICDAEDLVAIADAVRASNGSTETYNVPELSVAAVSAIVSGGGSSEGEGLDTCSVEIYAPNYTIQYYAATVVNNGVIETVYVDARSMSQDRVILNNVLCNSVLIASSDMEYMNHKSSNGVTILGKIYSQVSIARAPGTAGVMGHLNHFQK